jgi:hypothetical protein
VSAGTLELRETKSGLEFEGTPAPTSYAQDLLINVRAGNKGGMSIGFDPVKDEWFDDQGRPSNRHVGTRRILREVRLPEVSCVTNPAYKDTTLMARDALLAEREERAGNAPGNGKLPYGKVKYADPGYQKDGKKRYPIDTSKHIHAAWSYINKAANAGAYSAAQLSKIKGRIKAAAAKIGMKISAAMREADLDGYCPRHGYAGHTEERHVTGAEQRIKKSSAKRVLQIDAELKQAIELFKDIDKLPEDAQRAVALVTSAAEHAEHIAHKEDLGGDDLSKTSRSEQEPESSTSANDDPALALRELEAARLERSRKLDPSEA